MPLTAAERMKKTKLNQEDKYEDYKMKMRKTKKKQKKKQALASMSTSKKITALKKQKETIIQRLHFLQEQKTILSVSFYRH